MRRLATTLALLALAAPSAAGELQLGFRGDVEYDSRVIGDEDVLFTFGPTLRVEDEGRRWNWSLDQSVEYQKFLEHPGLDDFRIRQEVSGALAVNQHVSVRVSNNFALLPLLRTGESDLTQEQIDAANAAGETLTPDFRGDSGDLVSNSFLAALTVVPVERLSFTSQIGHLYRDYDNESINSQDTSAVTLTNQGAYQVHKDHQVGAGFRYTNRTFDTGGLEDESTTETYNAFGSWTWQMDGRTRFSITAGPAWSEDDQGDPVFPRYPTIPGRSAFLPDGSDPMDPTGCGQVPGMPGAVTFVEVNGVPAAILTGNCNPVPGQAALTENQQQRLAELEAVNLRRAFGEPEDDTDVNAYFSLSLEREWNRLGMRLAWNRSDSQTRSLGSATIVDSVLARVGYDLNARTSLSLLFNFQRRGTDVEREVLTPILAPVLEPTGIDGLMGSPVLDVIPQEQRLKQILDTYNLQLNLRREFGRFASAFVRLSGRYNESVFELNDFESSASNTQWQVQVGFNYRFDPVRF